MSRVFIVALTTALIGFFATDLAALKIVDYQKKLNPRFAKRPRKSTRFIIIHSTEGSLPSSLRTLSRGKVRRRRYISRGGHAHYLIAKNGTVYRILDPKYRANHAGVSMWNGLTRTQRPFAGHRAGGVPQRALYRSAVPVSEGIAENPAKAVSGEGSGRPGTLPDRLFQAEPVPQEEAQRRKKDPGADNFDRRRAGLTDAYPHDPDVVAGRVGPDPDGIQVARKSRPKASTTPARKDGQTEGQRQLGGSGPGILKKRVGNGSLATTAPNSRKRQDNGRLISPAAKPSRKNTITARRTAWKIAGRQYKAATTLYRFPDGRSLRGHEIRDWSDIPSGTVVELGVEEDKVVSAGSGGSSASGRRRGNVSLENRQRPPQFLIHLLPLSQRQDPGRSSDREIRGCASGNESANRLPPGSRAAHQ